MYYSTNRYLGIHNLEVLPTYDIFWINPINLIQNRDEKAGFEGGQVGQKQVEQRVNPF